MIILIAGGVLIGFLLITYNQFTHKKESNDSFFAYLRVFPRFLVLACIIMVFVIGILLELHDRRVTDHIESNGTFKEMFKMEEYSQKELKRRYPDLYRATMKTGKLAGYRKYQKEQNDFRYIYYINTGKSDSTHPALLFFIEYLGDIEYQYYTNRVDFYMGKGRHHVYTETMNASKYYCVIANGKLDSLEYIDYEAAFYMDKKQQEQDLEEHNYKGAVKIEQIRLQFH